MGLVLTVTVVVAMIIMITTEVRLIKSEERRREMEEDIKKIEARRYILETERMKREMFI